MRGNTITITLGRGRVGQTGKLFQWDRGQRLIIEGCNLPATYEVHYSNDELGRSKPMIGDSTGVDIPDEYLNSGSDIHVWVYVVGDDHAETEYHGIIKVTPRAMPTDIEPTPAQKTVIDQTIEALQSAVEHADEIAEGIPDAIDEALQEAKESGEFDGYTPQKGIDYWTDADKAEMCDELIDDTAGDGVTDKTWSADKLTDELNLKAPKANPEFTGSVSIGRKPNTTVGHNSFAGGMNAEASDDFAFSFGANTTATGGASHAEGNESTASAMASHAEGISTFATNTAAHSEGEYTAATGYASHAENVVTSATGYASHAEGLQTRANGASQHAGGRYNVESPLYPEWVAGTSYAVGDKVIRNNSGYVCKTANADASWKSKNWTNIGITSDQAFIIGNGKASARSNAAVVDFDGTAHFAGDVYIHANPDSTGGTKLITEDDIPDFPDMSMYAPKDNPVFTTAISMGRKADTTSGANSSAVGNNVEASGQYSHAEGNGTKASGQYSHAEGDNSISTAQSSHAEGVSTAASARGAHSEGLSTRAYANGSHAEGYQTRATSYYAHAEGNNTSASESSSHAEGESTTASGARSHAEGYGTTAAGQDTHVEGNGSTATAAQAHAEGNGSLASGQMSHAEGYQSTASGLASHAENWSNAIGAYSHAEGKSSSSGQYSHGEGINTVASGDNAHAEGGSTQATGANSHAEGGGTLASASHAHAEGGGTLASASHAHAEGDQTSAQGTASHAEGWKTIASNANAHAEGGNTQATGSNAHAEGGGTLASGSQSHAEGAGTRATGTQAHAEGGGTLASAAQAHAEGAGSQATGMNAHAEGGGTQATGLSSHAEGGGAVASGAHSHAEGSGTIANTMAMHAMGIFNKGDTPYSAWQPNTSYAVGDHVLDNSGYAYICIEAHTSGSAMYSQYWEAVVESSNEKTAFVIGNGTNATNRSNAVRMDFDGNAYFAGDLYTGSNAAGTSGSKVLTYTEKGAANGVAGLDANGKVPSSQLPSYVDDVLEYPTLAAFPTPGSSGIIYVALNTNKTYRWSGSEYIEISSVDITNKLDKPVTAGTLGQVLTSNGAGGQTWEDPQGGGGTVTDVQVNGTSVLDENGVANVPVADQSALGVVQLNSLYGIKAVGNGFIGINKADDNMVKTGTENNRPIVPSIAHASAFYGLAKAAGDQTQSASSNPVGTYTDGAKTAIKQMLGVTDPQVTDVQVNGTSVVTDGVANVPISNLSTFGVVKSGAYGINNNSGELSINRPSDAEVKSGASPWRVLNPAQQHQSVFYGLAKASGDSTQASSSNPVGTYTAEAKASIQSMLGVESGISLVETVTGTTPTITGQPNVRYMCGEVSTIDITPPASGTIDVIFTSGSTATVLTVPSTVKFPSWFDATALDADTIYEIMITDGVYGAVMTWAN